MSAVILDCRTFSSVTTVSVTTVSETTVSKAKVWKALQTETVQARNTGKHSLLPNGCFLTVVS